MPDDGILPISNAFFFLSSEDRTKIVRQKHKFRLEFYRLINTAPTKTVVDGWQAMVHVLSIGIMKYFVNLFCF
jgi:hypothetical protein